MLLVFYQFEGVGSFSHSPRSPLHKARMWKKAGRSATGPSRPIRLAVKALRRSGPCSSDGACGARFHDPATTAERSSRPHESNSSLHHRQREVAQRSVTQLYAPGFLKVIRVL